MEEKKLHLDAPFLSMRRISTKPENSNESENVKKKKTTRRKVKDSCQDKDHDQSLDHVMKQSSIPFLWEQTPGKPKDHHHHHMAKTFIEESNLIKALNMVSLTTSFEVSEFKKNGERLSNLSRDDVILEHHEVIKKKKQSIALKRVSMALNQDLRNVNDDYDDHNHVNSNVSKKALFGICSKNSLDVLNPVLSRVKTCQNLGVKPGKTVNPNSLDSLNKTKPLPRILRSNRIMSKSQELYPFSTEVFKISLPRNLSRLQRTLSTGQIQRQDMRFLVEEVKRRRNINKTRSETSQISVSQPPLPKTPSESWLCRTLPRSLAASVVSGQAAGFKKMMDQKTNPQSIIG